MPYTDPADQRAYQRRWMAERRQAWRDTFGGKCEQCEATENLEFHHSDPATKIPVSFSWRVERIALELCKCVLLCNGCHLKQHPVTKHGTHMYKEHGCRCEVCRDAMRAKNARHRVRSERC